MTMKDDGLCETVMVISLAGPKHQGAGEIGDVIKNRGHSSDPSCNSVLIYP